MQILHNTSFDFLRWRWHAIVLSWVVILAGLGVVVTKGIPLGIEFAGGTAIIAQFEQMPSVEDVRSTLDKNFPGGGQNVMVTSFGDPGQRQVMVRKVNRNK